MTQVKTHEEKLTRVSEALLCKEYADIASASPTLANIEKAEHMTEWFEKKYQEGWRKYTRKERTIAR